MSGVLNCSIVEFIVGYFNGIVVVLFEGFYQVSGYVFGVVEIQVIKQVDVIGNDVY